MNLMVTERLLLSPLAPTDHVFISELLNTEGWLRFIGDRNIRSEEDALAYITKINNNPSITYYTVRLKATQQPVGLVTLIQRDYLTQPDIGFAFLPAHNGNGYAYEAASVVLAKLWSEGNHPQVHAVTLPGNIRSIKLLEKLGLHFEKTIEVNNDLLHLYTCFKAG